MTGKHIERNGNGTFSVSKSFLFSLLIILICAAATAIVTLAVTNEKVDNIKHGQELLIPKVDEHRERIVSIEVSLDNIEKSNQRIENKLDALNDKIDGGGTR